MKWCIVMLLIAVTLPCSAQTSAQKARMMKVISARLKESLHDPGSYRPAKWKWETESTALDRVQENCGTMLDSIGMFHSRMSNDTLELRELQKQYEANQYPESRKWLSGQMTEVNQKISKKDSLLNLVAVRCGECVSRCAKLYKNEYNFHVYHEYRAKNGFGVYRLGAVGAVFGPDLA